MITANMINASSCGNYLTELIPIQVTYGYGSKGTWVGVGDEGDMKVARIYMNYKIN